MTSSLARVTAVALPVKPFDCDDNPRMLKAIVPVFVSFFGEGSVEKGATPPDVNLR